MPDITAKEVKALRDATNVSMMECKKALIEADGNIEKATKLLREKGMAVATKRAAKATNQGKIASAEADGGKTRSLVEVNCETDFVARNEDFIKFVEDLAVRAVETDEALSALCNDELMSKVAAIGENLKIRRNVRYMLQGTGAIGSYIHLGGKVGVLVELGCTKDETTAADEFKALLSDLTLHIAACNPRHLKSDEVPADVVAAEREIYAKQVEGKPANIVDKIVDGKINKFYGEICLIDQPFVKEPKQSITELLAEKGKALGDTLEIRRFERYQLGV